MKIAKILPNAFADGPGARTSIYFAGCSIRCKGCHNEGWWDPNTGHDMTVKEIMNYIKTESLQTKKVSILGGEPFDDYKSLRKLVHNLYYSGYEIWLYTGHTLEELLIPIMACGQYSCYREILYCIDVLVDGPFIQKLKNENLKYRGSSNQRIIDMRKTLKQGKLVLWGMM